MAFEPVSPEVDLPALEERVLARWREREIFRRSLERTADGPLFRFYEGPPTANGRPGVHHVEARVFKDVFPRYRTMKGERVPRMAGWDCHGIPVELEVEKDLGFSGKGDIEKYGVEEFNARCRESVTRYVAEFRRLTERIGFWVDTDDAYWTMSDTYVESVWWSLAQLFDKGLLYQDHRVSPYCPRCGTALSEHEVAQGYQQVDDRSVYVRLPLLTGPLAQDVDLLVWTTMPWTFVATTAAVVGPDIRYVLARGGRAGERPVVVAEERVTAALGADAEIIREVSLDELVGARYRGPFDLVGPGSPADPDGDPASWRTVVVDDFVTTDQGSGIVSTGAAFGADDMRVARNNGMPVVNPVGRDGRFDDTAGPYAGMDVREADASIVRDLEDAGLLVFEHDYSHTYPFCWRCRTALIYYAKPSWYIATTTVRDRMVEDNAEVDWRPPHIRTGRYGDWLANNVDWALSRERYWGTPLPLWTCAGCDHVQAVSSRAELSKLAGDDLSTMDLHRPHVDRITFDCSHCGATMHRVPEVVDAWYDSGSMPFAQFGFPHTEGSRERFAEMAPADYICEAIDQTRGWFYSLQAVSTSVFGTHAYQRALCLGHIVDDNGRKMSKSAGNTVDPWTLIDRHGADALRWSLLVEGNPWQSRRVGDASLREITRRLLLTLWNTYLFFVEHANQAGWTPDRGAPPVPQRSVLDRYVLAELADAVSTVDSSLADFDANGAGDRLARFVDDLSNWYVRCSRARFAGDAGALATLHTCLVTLSGLLAPFVPFLADELHENLVRSWRPDAAESVHLTDFPTADDGLRDDDLRAVMAVARRVVTLGRAARRAAGIPVRQPLRRASITLPEQWREAFGAVSEVLAAELNVKEVDLGGLEHSVELKPNFRALGKVFGRATPNVAQAIREVDAAAVAGGGSFQVVVDGAEVTVTADQVELIEKPLTGWQVATDGPFSCALDVTLDEDLRLEGHARELARSVNDLRRRSGLRRGERIVLRVAVERDPDGEIAAMLDRWRDRLARDVGADGVTVGQDSADEQFAVGNGRVRVSLMRNTGARSR
ncbi:isoleucine--tRNA ligase [Allokutzneria sp. A3M-2-11 16]|uniref:isoleucine--tRNA ligase n=1 Tax=Allokutzneria sp. A3M-2-11 16 TaxID=2962043 RepID=UPI0020B6FDC8|nr:isoleucine--tRNA ligase [Allokutzneria sp. A3M-2-11 16]MCP3803493.1 isoleucine--tRNA ligase [Allokutzneria sp. A3M-2-11 16]